MPKEPWRLEKEQMVRDFHVWNKDAVKGQTVFTGSSLMEMFPIEEWVKELGSNAPIVYNRGVGGYRTTDLLPILDACVFELKPHKVFINIGTNQWIWYKSRNLIGNHHEITCIKVFIDTTRRIC